MYSIQTGHANTLLDWFTVPSNIHELLLTISRAWSARIQKGEKLQHMGNATKDEWGRSKCGVVHWRKGSVPDSEAPLEVLINADREGDFYSAFLVLHLEYTETSTRWWEEPLRCCTLNTQRQAPEDGRNHCGGRGWDSRRAFRADRVSTGQVM